MIKTKILEVCSFHSWSLDVPKPVRLLHVCPITLRGRHSIKRWRTPASVLSFRGRHCIVRMPKTRADRTNGQRWPPRSEHYPDAVGCAAAHHAQIRFGGRAIGTREDDRQIADQSYGSVLPRFSTCFRAMHPAARQPSVRPSTRPSASADVP